MSTVQAMLHAGRQALHGQLPPRYAGDPFVDTFTRQVTAALQPGMCILDAGSGRRPAIEPAGRPSGSRYAGLDLSLSELRKAPPGSYSEVYAGDIVDYQPDLEGRFDLVVSFQVLEHVRPLETAIDNLRRYLRPGGRLIAQLSGARSLFALANRAVPQQLAIWALERLLAREPDTVFPAYYDRCWYDALQAAGAGWSVYDVIPIYAGADYLRFSHPLQAVYLLYEEWVFRGQRANLAAYYVVSAVR